MDYQWTIYLKDGGFTRCTNELLHQKMIEHENNIIKVIHRSAE